MWKLLQKSPAYFIKFYHENDEFTVSITNYVNIWTSMLSMKSFLHILKESNEDMEFDDDSILLDKGINILSHPEELKNVSIEEKDGKLSVLFTKSYGYVLWLNLDFVLSSNMYMFKEVIQPLLKTVNDLRASQSELIQKLKEKDKEIEVYKCEKGEITLKSVKTGVFNEAAHMNKYKKYDKYMGNVEILEELLQPTVLKPDIRIKSENHNTTNKASTAVKQDIQETIKSDNITLIKTEPSSQDVTAENSTNTDSNERTNVETSKPSNNRNKSDNSTANSPNNYIKPKLEGTPRKKPRNKLNL